MINFRFHLVSLVAVFLALGLGILVGSTVIDQGIVNRLDTEIRNVSRDNSASRSANDKLSAANKRLQQFIDDAAPFVGDGRLDGQSIAIVAERGVDQGVLKDTAALLRSAGADVPGVLWLNDSWRLSDPKEAASLQSALGLRGDASSMRRRAFELLARRLAKAPARPPTSASSTSTSTTNARAGTPARRRVDALAELEQSGFVDVSSGDASAFDAFPSRVVEALVVTGDASHLQGVGSTAELVRALTGANVPTVVAASYDPGSNQATAPARGASLAPVLDDTALARRVSTVDDLEMTQGRVVVVLALEVIGSGTVGRYGYGPDASAVAPSHKS